VSPGIAIQLYTLRAEESARALPRVLERLAQIGYAAVEPAGLWGLSAREFRRHCEDVGIVIPATHLQLTSERGFASELEELAELGLESVVVPQLDSLRSNDADGMRRAVDSLNRLGARANALGLALGYHNHEWEYAQRFEGRSVHRWLFDALEPGIFAEVDVYWAQVGGADPVEELELLGARARMLHLKDGPGDDPEAPMCALGDGALDLTAILAGSRAQWHVVEIDHTRGDLWEAIERSHAYLASAPGA